MKKAPFSEQTEIDAGGSLFWKKSLDMYDVGVHCFCLMDNQFAMMLMTPQGNLSQFMQRFNTAYTMYFNTKYDRIGHLFKERYRVVLFDKDPYLLKLSRYIHLTPVRSKAVENLTYREKVEILNNYPWSSYLAYTGATRITFLQRTAILNMFDQNIRKAEKLYKKSVLEGLKGVVANPLQEVKRPGILGSDDFAERVLQQSGLRGNIGAEKIGGESTPGPAPIPIKDIASEVAREFNVEPSSLTKRYSSSRLARQVLAELCCRYAANAGCLGDLALDLEMGASGLSMSRRRLREKLARDVKLKTRFAKLQEKLSRRL